MKRILLFLVSLLVLGSVNAKSVDAVTARRVAIAYMQAQGMKNASSLVDITSQTPFTEFYVFAAEKGGFVLVSGDDCVIPVLGYSTFNRFETKGMPEHVFEWYNNYEKEIRAIRTNGSRESRAVSQQWQALLDGEDPIPLLTEVVSPLMTTTWNQGTYYNELCPYHDSTEARSVTGCTATATAQVMKYWNHPTTGYGSNSYTSVTTKDGVTYTFPNLTADFGATTYQWNDMPNALNATSSSDEVNAVATLMYHVGVADEMKYSPRSSSAGDYNYYGTIRASSQTALMKYFKYRSDMAPVARVDYPDSVFCALLRAELDQNRPIIYSGFDTSAGHCFVLDGYDDESQFHVNWGWGGLYDGYYVIGNLHPSSGGIGSNSSHTFNMKNVATIGNRPNADWSTTAATTVAVASNGSGYVEGGGIYSFGDTVELSAFADAGYRFDGWSDGSKFNPREIIATGGSYTFSANFVPVGVDTVSYCPGNFQVTRFRGPKWGIHLPSSSLVDTMALQAVQLFVGEAGVYDVTIYTGANHETVATTKTSVFGEDDVNQWQTIVLDTSVLAMSDIWIIFTCYDADYPANVTYGSGCNGAFVWGGILYEVGIEWGFTAMIKGIMTYDPALVPERYSVTINRLCGNCGDTIPAHYVAGQGTYFEGSNVTLSALTIDNDLRFVYWINEYNDTLFDNPYSFDIHSDRTFTAVFNSSVGIDEAASLDNVKVSIYDGRIVVEGMDENISAVSIFDVMGRPVCTYHPLQVASSKPRVFSTSQLPSGVYLVRVGDGSARRVVVVR